jgi:hypothetical protein
MTATTHKVPVEEQKVHHIPNHARGFQPLLLGPIHHKVSPESSGLLDVRERGVEDRRAVERDVGERRGAVGTGSMVVLPFVEVVSAAISAISGFQGATQETRVLLTSRLRPVRHKEWGTARSPSLTDSMSRRSSRRSPPRVSRMDHLPASHSRRSRPSAKRHRDSDRRGYCPCY